MLGLGSSLAKGGASLLTYVKDNLKLYLDFKSNKSDTLKFPCEGSTYFDGNDYISVADNDGFTFADGTAITISIWFKTSEATDEMFIFDMRSGWANASGISVLLDGNATNYLGFFADGSASASFTNTTDYHDGKWHHLASTFDGTSVATSYIDGVSVGTDTQALGAINCDDLVIGMGQDKSSSGFQGYLANFAIWSRALSVEEINSIMRKNYSQLGSVEKTSLVSWWALDSASNTNGAVDSQTETLGTEKITNGGFDADSDWTKSSVTISGGKANFSSGGSTALYQDIGSSLTGLYKVTFEVTDYTSGTLDVYGGGQDSFGDTELLTVNAVGSYTAYIILVGSFNGNIIFGGGSFTGSIDNVSVKEVTSGNTGVITGATTTTSVYGGNAPILPRAVDVAREGEAEAIGNGSASFTIADTDYIVINNTGIVLHDWTISFWVRTGANLSGSFPGIVSTRSGTLNDYQDGVTLHYYDDYFDSEGASCDGHFPKVAGNTNLDDGEWHHVVFTCDRSLGTDGVKQYINGILISTDTSVDSATNADIIQIGARYYSTAVNNHWDGNIAQVGMWQGILTQAQVQSLYESTSYAKIPADVKSTLGSNVVVNGTFDADSNWSKGTGWTISDGKARCDGSATGNTNLQTSVAPLTSGKLYKVTFDLTRSAGNFRFLIGSSGSTDYYTTDGTHSFYKVEDGNDHVYAQGDSNFVGTLDNVIIKEVTNDLVGYWALDADNSNTSNGAGITNDLTTGETLSSELVGDASFDSGGGTNITISNATDTEVTGGALEYTDGSASDVTFLKSSGNILTSGNIYKLVFTIADTASHGRIKITFDENSATGSSYSDHQNYANGTHTLYTVAGQANAVINISASSPSFKMTDVSIKEVTSNTGVLK